MPQLSAQEILDLTSDREDQMGDALSTWNELSQVYRGNYRELQANWFRNTSRTVGARIIRHSWDMFARLVGKVPDKQVMPLGMEVSDRERAEAQEKVLINYDRVWGAKNKLSAGAHYLVGFGAMAVGTFPNPDAPEGMNYPMLLVEDPRNVYPGPTWDAPGTKYSSTYDTPFEPHAVIGGGLEDMAIRKRMTGGQLLDMFGSQAAIQSTISQSPKGRLRSYPVLQYYDAETVTTVLEAPKVVVLRRSPHGAPWCPWQYASMFGIDEPEGSSMFSGQVGLELAFARILDQKLSLNDAVTWPWLKQRGFAEFDAEKRRITITSPDGDVDFLTPPPEFQVDQDMQLIRGLLQILNFETEATQGTVRGGPITGQGLRELNSVVTETTQSFYEVLADSLSRVYATAMLQDAKVYGDAEKVMAGKAMGETFFESYTPSDTIGDRVGMVSVEYGPGLGGFEGHMQMLQSLGAETVSEDRVMEKNPHIPSVRDEKRRILLNKLEKMLTEQALSGETAVPMDWLAQLIGVVERGEDYRKWIEENPPQQQGEEQLPGGAPAGLPGGGPGGGAPGIPGGTSQPGGGTIRPPAGLQRMLGVG